MTPPTLRTSGTVRRRYLAGAIAVLFIAASANACAEDRLVLTPESVELRGTADCRQVVATRLRDDGSAIDVTRLARWRAVGSGVVAIGNNGFLEALKGGAASIHVEIGGLAASMPIHVGGLRERTGASFRLDVSPALTKGGCNQGACHGALSGKGGFRLSLRGDDPAFDWLSITHEGLGRRIDAANAAASLVLAKPTAQTPHEGGKRFEVGSASYETLLHWISEGARDDGATAPRVVRLEVFPLQRIVAPPTHEQQLAVTAVLNDGSRRDVTRQATYDSSEPNHLKLSPNGLATVVEPIEAAVSIRYASARTVSRLAFPPHRPHFVWNERPARHPIDEPILAKLRAVYTQPTKLVDDATFLRRAYLAAIGVLPTPAEVRAFLADRKSDKRRRVAVELVGRPEFADFWALKWADVLRNETKTMGVKGTWGFQRWLAAEIARDAPMDDFVRSLLTGVGSTWSNPPASFYRTNRDPNVAAEAVGQVFLGYRIQCAKCHNHPFDVWKQDDYYGLAAFFANVQRKQRDNTSKDAFDKHEINCEEIVYTSGRAEMVQPTTGRMLAARPLGAPAGAAGDRNLEALADWVVKDPQFPRNLANRVWYHLLGRGVVDPPDDFRDSNPPSNPELLDVLTTTFVNGGLRLKPLVREILTSDAFQRQAPSADDGPAAAANFAEGVVRPMTAEVLLDAVSQVLEQPEKFTSGPAGMRAAQLPGSVKDNAFLQAFGKPERLMTCECERNASTTLVQAFQMINGDALRRKLEAPDNRIGRLLAAKRSDAEIVEEFTLAALSRSPTAEERRGAEKYLQAAADRRKAFEDVVWAILNSKEFLLLR